MASQIRRAALLPLRTVGRATCAARPTVLAYGCPAPPCRRASRSNFATMLAYDCAAPPCKHASRRNFAAARPDPHVVLGVRRGASAEEVRKVYLRMARKHHPDMNPHDRAAATARFQQIGAAFSELRDGSRTSGATSSKRPSGAASSNGFRGAQPYGDHSLFDELHEEFLRHWAEAGLDRYIAEIRGEANDAINRSRDGDLSGLWSFAKNRPGVVLSVVLPAALLFRAPVLVVGALRFAVGAPLVALRFATMLPPQVQFFIFARLWQLWSSGAHKRRRRRR